MKYAGLLKKSLAAALFFGLAQAASAAEPDAAQLERGKTLFVSAAVPACAVCHTLADAGSSGAIGPNLDELKPNVDQIKKVVREGMGAMPAFSTMSADDVNAVAAYVAQASGGAK